MLVRNLIGSVRAYSVWTDPGAWSGTPDISHVGGATSSGTPVSEQGSLAFSAVWAAVTLISEAIAGMSWHVMQKTKTGKEALLQHPLNDLLHVRASPDMSASQFRETMQGWCLTWGNGYAEITREYGGPATKLTTIAPDRVKVRRRTTPDDAGEYMQYEITNDLNQTDRVIPARNMMHVHGFGDGMSGYSVVRLARESIGLGLATEKFGASFFGSGARPGGVFTYPGKLSPEARERFLHKWQESHGPSNQHRTAIFEQGMQWQSIGIPPDDSQFLETRIFQIDEIARWFKVPPHMLAELSHAHFKNIEHMAIQFVTRALLPWVKRWEQEADWRLLSPAERRAGLFTKLNVNTQLRGDTATRGAYYKLMHSIGSFSTNDILELEDRNTIGPEGDTRFIPMNLVPLDQAAALVDRRPSGRTGQPPRVEDNSAIQTKVVGRVINDALKRSVAKEAKAVRRAWDRHDGKFLKWVAEFYTKQRSQIAEALDTGAHIFADLAAGGDDSAHKAADLVQAEFTAAYIEEAVQAVGQAHSHDRVPQMCEAWCAHRAEQKSREYIEQLASVVAVAL